MVKGQVNPYQGWVSHGALQQTPAPVVTMTRTGPGAAILTLIAATVPGADITAAIGPYSPGWYQLRIDIGGTRATFLISAGGEIQQG